MTINSSGSQLASYQSITYSSVRINVFTAASQTTSGATSATQTPSPQPNDTVSLSSGGSTSPAASNSNTPTSGPVPLPPPPARPLQGAASTGSTSKASAIDDPSAALFKALDADEDGTVTEDEFKAGARALLRQGRRGEHAGGVHHGDHDHRGGRRLNRALGRLFDAVDADGDGGLTKEELSAALQRTSKPAQAPAPPPEGLVPTQNAAQPSTNQEAAGAGSITSASFVSVTVVSVAIRSYTAFSQTSGTTDSTAKPADGSTPQSLPAAA